MVAIFSIAAQPTYRLSRAAVASCLATLLCCLSAQHLQAQQAPDVIRGRVTDDSSRALVAKVMITRGPDRLTQEATTARAGNFRIRFEEGTGDYLGLRQRAGSLGEGRVQRGNRRTGAGRQLPLRARGSGDARTRTFRGNAGTRQQSHCADTAGAGASEKWRDGRRRDKYRRQSPAISTQWPAPCRTLRSPEAARRSSVGDPNESQHVNGMGLAAGSIPRAARTETRVTGATFDPTRGGFSARTSMCGWRRRSELPAPQRVLTFDPRYLQFTDAAGRSLGATQRRRAR